MNQMVMNISDSRIINEDSAYQLKDADRSQMFINAVGRIMFDDTNNGFVDTKGRHWHEQWTSNSLQEVSNKALIYSRLKIYAADPNLDEARMSDHVEGSPTRD